MDHYAIAKGKPPIGKYQIGGGWMAKMDWSTCSAPVIQYAESLGSTQQFSCKMCKIFFPQHLVRGLLRGHQAGENR